MCGLIFCILSIFFRLNYFTNISKHENLLFMRSNINNHNKNENSDEEDFGSVDGTLNGLIFFLKFSISLIIFKL